MNKAQAFSALVLAFFCAGCSRTKPPYSPAEALRTFSIDPGFRVELFAAEPLVNSPVAMEVDEDGRVWVVEDPGYPLNTEGKVGRIKLLEDTDGDGIPDRATVFADKLVMPIGIMRWKKGVLVTDAPDVLYLEDTDGDGRADVRKVVLTGFPFTNPQHMVNGPLYGLDNWVYLAHEPPAFAVIYKDKFGDRGGDIRFPDRPDVAPVKEKGHNIRFRPDTFELEALSGSSQFGHAFDEWGHHFTLNNSNHLRHEVLAARYLKRNPDLALGTAMEDISDHGNAAEVFPIVANPKFEMLSNIGQFTSACGLTLYLGGAFPPGYQGNAFVAEPAHSLVHRDLLSGGGAAFVGRRARDKVEFLASTDAWCRPVNMYIGPDGALYLLDFYRPHIEHPEWMSSQYHHHHEELNQGNDRGRIYRIVPQAGLPSFAGRVHLGSAPDSELVRQLANADIWWRRTAQRLLVDRKSAGPAPALVRLFRESTSPLARLHALWTLEGIGRLPLELVEAGLEDAAPGVRENAVVLAEARLAAAPQLAAWLLRMAADSDSRVRFQLLCTLGQLNSPAARQAREKLLLAGIEDKWVQVAALSASSDEAPRLLALAASRAARDASPALANLARRAAVVVGARARQGEIHALLASAAPDARAPEAWKAAALEGLASGLRVRAGAAQARPFSARVLKLFTAARGAPLRKASLRVLEITGLPPGAEASVQAAARVAGDANADPELRADSIALLALAGSEPHAGVLRNLVESQAPEPVRAAAVRALARVKGANIAAFLLANWRSFTGPVRSEALDALLMEPERVRLLLNALRKQEVQPWVLTYRHRARLTMYPEPAIRDEARAIIEQADRQREQLLKQYEPALASQGEAARGKAVFERACAKCHRLNGQGQEVGPALETVRNQPKAELLRNILLPSSSIAQNYESYVIETVSGRMLDGVIGEQTPTSITLRQEGGRQEVIPRGEIRQMYASNVSAMPDGLEKQIDLRQMADLLEYIKNGGEKARPAAQPAAQPASH